MERAGLTGLSTINPQRICWPMENSRSEIFAQGGAKKGGLTLTLEAYPPRLDLDGMFVLILDDMH